MEDPVRELALGRLRLGLKLRSPVLKRLTRDALQLAILPLIQVATLPGIMVRPPEGLVLTSPCSVLALPSRSPQFAN